MPNRLPFLPMASCLLLALLATSSGCTAFLAPYETLPVTPPGPPPLADVPRELAMVSLPTYIIEPSDDLLIDILKTIPKSPYFIQTGDLLAIQALGTLLDEPIFGEYQVDETGQIDLGASYGKVSVVGQTIDEIRTSVTNYLLQIVEEAEVSVALSATAGSQRVSGQHLVLPDGTINLGTYGTVFVAGMTLEQTRAAIEQQLSTFLESPQVLVDVFGYNSKGYYIVTAGAQQGDTIRRFPFTGNETVLDAIALNAGLTQISSKRMWIARPAPNGVDCDQILPIDWDAISRSGSTSTNYQMMPGDRLFIADDPLLTFANFIGEVTRPLEQVFGFNLLGVQMVNRFRNIGDSRRNQ